MYDNEDRLREAMEDHEYLAPDQVAVWARVELLARIYRRRSAIARSAGSVVLGAGLVAGLVQMHSFIQGGVERPPATTAPVAAPPPSSPAASSPPPAPVTSSAHVDPDLKRTDAYFEAGYGWDEAVRLARLWRLKDPADAKIEAGRRLLAGEQLPLRPR